MANKLSKPSRSSFDSIGIVVKYGDDSALAILRSILPTLESFRKKNPRTRFYLDTYAEERGLPQKFRGRLNKSVPSFIRLTSLSTMTSKVKLIIAIGGDGTLLRSSRFVLENDRWKEVSLLGINAGHLGFLTFIPSEDARQILMSTLTARPRTEARSCLNIRIERKGKVRGEYHVLNDCVLNRGSVSRILEFQVQVDGEFLSSYRADGIIVSTPTGATAYNLAAGGSILEPAVEAIQLTPICAQSFSNKPIVLHDQHKIQLSVAKLSKEVYLTLDGHTAVPLTTEDRVIVQKSPKIVRFLLPPSMDSYHYFHSLRQKLKWGLVSRSSP